MIAREQRKGKKLIEEDAKADRREIKLTKTMTFSISRRSESNTPKTSTTGKFVRNNGLRTTKSLSRSERNNAVERIRSLGHDLRLVSPKKDYSPAKAIPDIIKQLSEAKNLPRIQKPSSKPSRKNAHDVSLDDNDKLPQPPLTSAIRMKKSERYNRTSSPFRNLQNHLSLDGDKWQIETVKNVGSKSQAKNRSTIINLLRKNVHRDRINQPIKKSVSINRMLFPSSTEDLTMTKEPAVMKCTVVKTNFWCQDVHDANKVSPDFIRKGISFEKFDVSMSKIHISRERLTLGDHSQNTLMVPSRTDARKSGFKNTSNIPWSIDTTIRQDEVDADHTGSRPHIAQSFKLRKSRQLRSFLSTALKIAPN